MLSPGVAMAVVTRNAIAGGRLGAILTVLGINCGNSVYALSSALGLSIIFTQTPAAVDTVKVVGALYLGGLGVQSVWRAASWGVARRPAGAPDISNLPAEGHGLQGMEQTRWRSFTEGLLTNLLHPAVALFYLTYVPQFIEPGEPHFATFMMLAAIHIGVSFGWLTLYGIAIDSLGSLFARPRVRRSLEGVTGVALLVMAIRFLFGG